MKLRVTPASWPDGATFRIEPARARCGGDFGEDLQP
jgi:hypothetical protein